MNHAIQAHIDDCDVSLIPTLPPAPERHKSQQIILAKLAHVAATISAVAPDMILSTWALDNFRVWMSREDMGRQFAGKTAIEDGQRGLVELDLGGVIFLAHIGKRSGGLKAIVL